MHWHQTLPRYHPSHTHLPITVARLFSLKTELWDDASYSLLYKGCDGQHLHWLFMASSGPVNLHHQPEVGECPVLNYSIAIDLQQSETDFFRWGYAISIQATLTSTNKTVYSHQGCRDDLCCYHEELIIDKLCVTKWLNTHNIMLTSTMPTFISEKFHLVT